MKIISYSNRNESPVRNQCIQICITKSVEWCMKMVWDNNRWWGIVRFHRKLAAEKAHHRCCCIVQTGLTGTRAATKRTKFRIERNRIEKKNKRETYSLCERGITKRCSSIGKLALDREAHNQLCHWNRLEKSHRNRWPLAGIPNTDFAVDWAASASPPSKASSSKNKIKSNFNHHNLFSFENYQQNTN